MWSSNSSMSLSLDLSRPTWGLELRRMAQLAAETNVRDVAAEENPEEMLQKVVGVTTWSGTEQRAIYETIYIPFEDPVPVV